MSTDILLVGATGYTGRLISEYLSSHPDRQSHNLKLTLVGRSHSKLTHLFNSLPSKTNISILVVSSLSSESLNLQNTFLVINTVGPYFSLSPTLAHQCALSSTHYLDLSGEPHQLFSLIQKYNTHGSALSSRALIIPSCGYDSIPSDLSSYLSAKALFDSGKQPGKSTTVHSIGGSLSGGTIATALSTFSIPRSFLKLSTRPFASSPIVGPKPFPKPQLIYNLSIPGFTSYIGSFFPMSSPNISVVQRSYGLLELDHIENPTSPNFHYGSKFTYDEFLKVQSRLTAFLYSSTIFTCMILLFFKPLRALATFFLPPQGSGPSKESLPNGYFKATNFTLSADSLSFSKTTLKASGDPGYFLTSIMISECALSILIPSSGSFSEEFKTKINPSLPPLAHNGGLLTPSTALGDVLVQRLLKTGKFSVETEVVDIVNGKGESRKRK